MTGKQGDSTLRAQALRGIDGIRVFELNATRGYEFLQTIGIPGGIPFSLANAGKILTIGVGQIKYIDCTESEYQLGRLCLRVEFVAGFLADDRSEYKNSL